MEPKGIMLCNDILQKIGEEFKKIPNKPIDKIKHTHICRRCKQTQYCYSIDLSDGDGWEDNYADCNMRDRKKAEKRHVKKIKSNKCNCGKFKKTGFAMCYQTPCAISAKMTVIPHIFLIHHVRKITDYH